MILDYLACIMPLVVAFVVYFVRLESRITKISRDICWIKKEIRLCQPPSGDLSP
jgi:hypothetical protein